MIRKNEIVYFFPPTYMFNRLLADLSIPVDRSVTAVYIEKSFEMLLKAEGSKKFVASFFLPLLQSFLHILRPTLCCDRYVYKIR